MNVSDILSILGITIAIIALLPNEDREFIKNKFSKFNYVLFIIYFILINYLLFYQWWKKVIPATSFFENSYFPTTKTWSYLISILIIAFILYKIFFANFPKSRHKKLIVFYKKLLIQNKYTRLFEIIEKYNKGTIINYLDNNTNSFNTYIFEKILSNSIFIKSTEPINSDIYVLIFKKINNKNPIINKYIIQCLQIEHSILNTQIQSNPNIEDNDLLLTILEQYDKINYSIFSQVIIDIENNKILLTFINFIRAIVNRIIDKNVVFSEYDSILKSINSLSKKEHIKKTFILEMYLDLLNNSNINKFHFSLIFEKFSIFICEHFINFSNNEQKKILKYFIKIDKTQKKEILKIRNELIIDNCRSHNEVIKTIYNLFNSEYKDYDGEFKSNVINIISNY